MIEQRAEVKASISTGLGYRLARWVRWWTKFARTQPLGAFGLAICLLVIVVGIFGPWIDRYDPETTSALERLQGPNAAHWFGTDNIGRDIYSRIVNGTRITIYVAFFSIAIGTTFGYLVGVVGGKTDLVIQSLVDADLSFPAILKALIIVSVLGAGVDKVIFAIAFSLVASSARVSRGVVLSVKETVYVDAARVIGASPIRIMFRHILPNSM